MKISEKIFKIMKKKGITQLQLSKETGIAQSTIADWKRFKTNPAASKILPICAALDCEPYDILSEKGKWCD